MSRTWSVAEGRGRCVAGYSLGALEQLAAGEVPGASVEVELWANRQLDAMTDMGWIESEEEA